MKTKRIFLFILSVVVLGNMMSCDWLDFGKDKEETDPEKTLGKVDNYWQTSASGYPGSTITIIENDGGNVVANISYDGDNYEVEGKITDQGIYDYVYSNGDHSKPFTLVKFDANVGDKWEFQVGDQKVVREVVHKSETDDTYYRSFYIKTIDIEETIPAGIQVKNGASKASKILWKFNHKYGFISAAITDYEGNTTNVTQYSTNAAQ